MAFSTVNISTALTNLKASFGGFKTLTVVIAFIIGIGLFMKGLMALRNHGQQGKESLTQAFAEILCGAALIYLPTTLDATLVTVFGSDQIAAADSLSSYIKPSSQMWGDVLSIIAQYMRLVGLIAFIRGWMILAKIGSANSGQQHTVGKGITHVVGGVALINFPKIAVMFGTLFGVT